MSFKVKVYEQTTSDWQRTKSDHKSSPCHFVTDELIKYEQLRYALVTVTYLTN
jgi:hypothetical protein